MSVTKDARRFGGIGRLYGETAAEKLFGGHVTVVGLGGVGSWCVEALVRTGVGHLTLVDGDTAELSNTNRQLHAMENNYGRYKAECLKERCLLINPDCRINVRTEYVTEENASDILPDDCDWVVDCIDDLKAKAALIAAAAAKGLHVSVAGGAGARIDPSRIVVSDLARAKGDPLLSKLRTDLRKRYGFPRGSADGKSVLFGISVAYSDEPLRQPGQDSIAAIGADENDRIGFGSSSVVTGSVGLRLASIVIDGLIKTR